MLEPRRQSVDGNWNAFSEGGSDTVIRKALMAAVLGAAGTLVLGSAVVFAAGPGDWRGGRMQPLGFFPFGLLGGLAGLLLLAGIVLLVIWAIRALAGPGSLRAAVMTPPPAPTPLDILARRFAAGEISADEYEKARDILKEAPKV
jgi:putative membrane protein